jgi:hypothetical protein
LELITRYRGTLSGGPNFSTTTGRPGTSPGPPKEYMGRVWSIASTMQNVFPFVGPLVGAAVFIGWFRIEMPKKAAPGA